MEITNDDELQLRGDLKRLVEELKLLAEENMKKEGTNLKELVDLIKQDRKETRTNMDRYSMRNSPNFNGKLKKKCFVCGDRTHLANTCPKKPKCYICQEIGHKSFECPQRKQQTESVKAKERPQKEKTVKRAGTNFKHPINLVDSGMYCCGVLHVVGITALVDSGATATLISETVYNKLPFKKRPMLSPVGCRMVAANGNDVPTIGVGEFTLSFSGKQFKLPAIVADINAEVILGLDCMQTFSCEIKVKDCTFIAEDIVIKCFVKEKWAVTALQRQKL